jgi:tRNA pseudouridine13 synthase
MKVKQSPDDFVVEELTDVQPLQQGWFAFYRLDKIGWTTPDALHVIRRKWNLDARRSTSPCTAGRIATSTKNA